MKKAWVWDAWQRQILEHQGNIAVRAGRQSGKSEVIAEKAKNFSRDNPETTIVVIAPAQRQSSLVFEKMRERCIDDPNVELAEKPTQTRIVLSNGSKIYCVPAGRTGYSIRGFTADIVIADEAPYIAESVWPVVTPMLAVSKNTRGFGWLIAIGTPFGKGGFFYNTFFDDDFLQIHVSSEQCKRISPVFLRKERKRMTKMMYRQEYLAEFCDDWHQFFPTELLKRQMTFIEWSLEENRNRQFYLGVDIARYGGDENAFVVAELLGKKVKIVKVLTTERVSTTDTIGRIITLDREFAFKKVFIDDAGVGGGVTDVLLDRLGRKVVGLNNASKRLEVQGEEKKRGILKEDMYSNALMMMETGLLEMISDLDLLRSLKSITYEYKESGKVKIFGAYSHLTEALVRACWCVKDRGLEVYLL